MARLENSSWRNLRDFVRKHCGFEAPDENLDTPFFIKLVSCFGYSDDPLIEWFMDMMDDREWPEKDKRVMEIGITKGETFLQVRDYCEETLNMKEVDFGKSFYLELQAKMKKDEKVDGDIKAIVNKWSEENRYHFEQNLKVKPYDWS